MRPQKRYPRTARLNESILEVLADELERMNDPRLELLTFTGVEVSRDLSHATVFFSTLGRGTGRADDGGAASAAAALESAAPHLRGVLGRALRIRQVPRLAFAVDHGIESGQRIDELLRRMNADDPDSGAAGSGETA
ncbi:MAG: 30S ribosome-binding factor RbfA [Actinomycetota bacterium]